MMTNDNVVRFELSENIALITLNRPKKRNALNAESLFCLTEAFEECKSNPDISIVVITGAEGPVFCAGADLDELIPLRTRTKQPATLHEREVSARFEHYLGSALLRNFDIGKPVICAANGHALAGGFELLLGCDLRVVASGSKYGLPETGKGLLAAAGGVARLPMNIPRCVAMEMLLTAQPISGERALTLGLVNYCVPTDQVLPTALALAKAITKNSPIAVRSTRNAVKLGAGRPEQDGLMLEAIFGEKVMASADAIEGPKAFVEKRPPVWAKL